MAVYDVCQRVKTNTGYDVLSPLAIHSVIPGTWTMQSGSNVLNVTPLMPEVGWEDSKGIPVVLWGDTPNSMGVMPNVAYVYGKSYAMAKPTGALVQNAINRLSPVVIMFFGGTVPKVIAMTLESFYSVTAEEALSVDASNIQGVLEPEHGGTGVQTLSEIRQVLGLGDDASAPIPVSSGGTGGKDPYSARVGIEARTTVEFHVTLPVSWSGTGPWTQALAIQGILESDTVIIDVELSGTVANKRLQTTAWGCVSQIDVTDNTITATCIDNAPTTAIPIHILCIRQ